MPCCFPLPLRADADDIEPLVDLVEAADGQGGFDVELVGEATADRDFEELSGQDLRVLFGLSMDYQVFLLSRIHERDRQVGDPGDAVVVGIGSTARIITGAALIIVAVFCGFAAGDLAMFPSSGHQPPAQPAGRPRRHRNPKRRRTCRRASSPLGVCAVAAA
jgi:MMPL family